MTARTHILSFLKRHFLAMPTLAAILRREGGVDSNVLSTSVFSFERKTICKSRPCRICNRLTQATIVHHPIDAQIFNADNTEAINYPPRLLMREVMPLELDSFVDTRHRLTPLRSFRCALLFFAQATLHLCQCLFFLAKEARVLYSLIRRKISEGFQANVNADLLRGFRQRCGLLDFTGKGNVPLACAATSDVAGLNLPFNRTMQFDVDVADFRECQVMPDNLKTCLRKGETIVAMLSPESWIASLFFRFDTAKESLKRKVKAHGDVLQDLAMHGLQRFTLLLQRAEAVDLCIERKRLAAFFVGVFTLFEQFVVQPTAFIQSRGQSGFLSLCRKDSELECLSFMHATNLTQSCVSCNPRLISP